MVLLHHFLLELALVDDLFSLEAELLCLFHLDFFEVLGQFFLLFLDEGDLLDQVFGEEAPKARVEQCAQEVLDFLVVAVPEVEFQYFGGDVGQQGFSGFIDFVH